MTTFVTLACPFLTNMFIFICSGEKFRKILVTVDLLSAKEMSLFRLVAGLTGTQCFCIMWVIFNPLARQKYEKFQGCANILLYVCGALIGLAGLAILVSVPAMWESDADGEGSFIKVWFVTLLIINALAVIGFLIQQLIFFI